MASSSNTFEGILLVDKPSGCTSHDVVARLRRKLKMKRIGHAGTLDPLATGLLVILLGKATKTSQYLMSLGKVYTGVMKLGEETDSQDSDGSIIATHAVPLLSQDDLDSCAKGFLGDQYQIPPMFSAKKVDGVPLYKLARKGQEVERKPRFIHIKNFSIDHVDLPSIRFTVACSKGTYIRTIAHDFGQKLGCGAHLTELRRLASDQLNVEKALSVDAIEALSVAELKEAILPVYQVVPSHVL
ncbi:MAG TPA: tRNA pseudouridine(55) synthase TruB [Opitutae bacterium]|mgnify:FL=1|nr:tRNA pseudouridine(55) synthase TruB [Opitutae bacterium]